MEPSANFAPFFQRLIDAPEAALAAIRDDPRRFEAALIDEEQGRLSADAAIPAYAALGVMLFDGDGARVVLDGPAWLPAVVRFDDLKADARARKPGSRLFTINEDEALPTHALWAWATEAARWNLPAACRQLLPDHPQGRVVLIAGGIINEGPLNAAARAYGLTDLERRVALAVVRGGGGRAAAAATGLSYATVRGALSTAARRMSAPNAAALVRALVAAAYGVLPGEGDPGAILADMLPLTERQGRIAALVAEGLSRHEIAGVTGRGAASVKKELETMYATLGVGSAAELARVVAEVRALRLFARSTDGETGFFDPNAEPTRFLPREDGTVIAWSDYGPRSGRPVLVVPSNWQTRPVPRPLLAALHAAGFRPISIDRPGIGGTPPPRDWNADPFVQAVADTRAVLDKLGVEQIAVVARGGAQFTAALKAQLANRIGAVVLVSPTPQTSEAGKRQGIMGVIKEAFFRNPATIAFFFRTICAQMTLKRLETLHRAIVAGSPTDEALLNDPQFVRDRFRAVRPLATGNMAGALREQLVISRGGYDYRPIAADDWVVLQGSQDTYNSYDEVERFWRPLLANARFEAVADGGRFMTSSHPALIVKTLAKALG